MSNAHPLWMQRFAEMGERGLDQVETGALAHMRPGASGPLAFVLRCDFERGLVCASTQRPTAVEGSLSSEGRFLHPPSYRPS